MENTKLVAFVWGIAARWLGAVMVWFGLMRYQAFAIDALAKLLEQYPWLPPGSNAMGLSLTLGNLQVGIGAVLLLAPAGQVRRLAALAAAMFWSAGLLLLLGEPMYVHNAAYNGFPVIGSGQTLLKHLGIAALALGVFASGARSRLYRMALYGLWLGQLLVLVWIGLMKFTHIEAVGVEGLMRSNLLFSWLYHWFDVQGASQVIGVIELLTAALILLWPWRPGMARWGLLLAMGTYLLTNTFMFSLPGWESGMGFPFIAGTGEFLIKDQLLLLGAWILSLVQPPRMTRGTVLE